MDQSKKRRTRKYLKSVLLSIASLFSAIFLVIAVTYSWNSFDTEVEVSNIQLNTISSDTLLISLEDKTQVTSYTYEYSGSLSQVTGNGDYFYEPVSTGTYQTSSENDYGNTITSKFASIDSTNLQKKSEEELTDKVVYLPFEFQAFRSLANVYVSSTSSITSATSYKGNYCATSYVGDEENRFSMDYVIGALRIAIQIGTKSEDSITYKTSCIWIPHPEIQLSYANDYYSLNPDGERESTITFHNNKDFYSLASDSFSDGVLKDSGITYVLGDMPSLFLKQLKDGELGYGRLVIWLEGTDRECQNPMIGYTDSQGKLVQGRFQFTFNLTL